MEKEIIISGSSILEFLLIKNSLYIISLDKSLRGVFRKTNPLYLNLVPFL